MSAWLKLGYFTGASQDPAYWLGTDAVTDGPGRRSPRWRTRARPRRGEIYPPFGPQYRVGDRLVLYLTGPGKCPAILEVTGQPRWDPDVVDQDNALREGDRWGVVTEVRGVHAVALDDAPVLEQLDIAPASVGQKGHIRLEDWQYEEAERLISGSRTPRRRPVAAAHEIPIEEGEVEAYEMSSANEVRRAERRESRLVRDYVASLQGERIFRHRLMPNGSRSRMYTDVFNRTRGQLIEAKATTSRNDIRMAIGQLADYGRFVSSKAERAVLLESKPHPDLLALLATQRISAIWREGDGFADNAGGAFT